MPNELMEAQSALPERYSTVSGAIVEQEMAIQETRARYQHAVAFPRDQAVAESKAKAACDRFAKKLLAAPQKERKALENKIFYHYERGGQTIEGPAVAVLREIARCWGNLDYGMLTYQQDGRDATVVTAFAIDMETNTVKREQVVVSHTRKVGSKAKGDERLVPLTDPRDILEHVNNFAARRQRVCLEHIIPRDVWEDAWHELRETYRKGIVGGEKPPTTQQIMNAVAAFDEQGVTEQMLAKFLRKPVKESDAADLNSLRMILRKIKAGAHPGDFFHLRRGEDSNEKDDTEEPFGEDADAT